MNVSNNWVWIADRRRSSRLFWGLISSDWFRKQHVTRDYTGSSTWIELIVQGRDHR